MTLCQNSKTKYFGRLFLAFVMLLGGVCFTTSNAKAAYDYSEITFNENKTIVNIPEYTGHALMLCQDWASGFSVNNATSTNIDLPVSQYDYVSIDYLIDPDIGNQSFSFAPDWANEIKCILINNFDIETTPSATALLENEDCQTCTSFNFNYTGENFLTIVRTVFWYTVQKPYPSPTNASSTLLSLIGNNNISYTSHLFEIEGANVLTNYVFNTGQASASMAWKLNIETVAPTPPSNDYVMYYGNNPVYTPINSNYNLPVVYNVCDSWEDGKIILKLNNDNASSLEKLLTQCSGTFNFNSGAGSSEMSNTSYFTIENFSDDTILATSGSFLSTVYTPLNASDGFIVWNFPAYQYFDYTKTATTSLAFQYNVCSDTNYSTSSKICIRNTSHPTNDPSSYCVNLETCSGTGNIEFPVFAQENSLTLNFSYYDKDNNYQLGSNQFSIVYYNGTYDTRAKWLVQAGEIACSPEEWASTDWWINIKCGVFTGGVAVAQTLGDSAAAGVRILIGMLDGVFPFNLPIKIKQCWDNSETKLLPSELNKINILDESGNVKVNMPSEWADSGSITIWGSDVWNATNESNEFFAFIRNLSKYLIWGVFILIFYLWGKSLIDK